MTNTEKCKEEILQIMQKYNCRFYLTWEDEVMIEDKSSEEETLLLDFGRDSVVDFDD
jgi:hypothetical protein